MSSLGSFIQERDKRDQAGQRKLIRTLRSVAYKKKLRGLGLCKLVKRRLGGGGE